MGQLPATISSVGRATRPCKRPGACHPEPEAPEAILDPNLSQMPLPPTHLPNPHRRSPHPPCSPAAQCLESPGPPSPLLPLLLLLLLLSLLLVGGARGRSAAACRLPLLAAVDGSRGAAACGHRRGLWHRAQLCKACCRPWRARAGQRSWRCRRCAALEGEQQARTLQYRGSFSSRPNQQSAVPGAATAAGGGAAAAAAAPSACPAAWLPPPPSPPLLLPRPGPPAPLGLLLLPLAPPGTRPSPATASARLPPPGAIPARLSSSASTDCSSARQADSRSGGRYPSQALAAAALVQARSPRVSWLHCWAPSSPRSGGSAATCSSKAARQTASSWLRSAARRPSSSSSRVGCGGRSLPPRCWQAGPFAGGCTWLCCCCCRRPPAAEAE